MKPGTIFGVVLLASVVFISCASTELELENLVRTYNQKLSEAYSSGDADGMVLFVTPRQFTRISSDVMNITKDARLLVISLIALRFEEVTIEKDPGSATARTVERWSQHYVDQRTRKPLTQPEIFTRTVDYSLTFLERRWVVDQVVVLDMKKET